jgi:hypothetical protein
MAASGKGPDRRARTLSRAYPPRAYADCVREDRHAPSLVVVRKQSVLLRNDAGMVPDLPCNGIGNRAAGYDEPVMWVRAVRVHKRAAGAHQVERPLG